VFFGSPKGSPLPTESTTDLQHDGYGRYAGDPSTEQLERYFHLDEHDLGLIVNKRSDHNRLGFALQLCTVRFLGTFLDQPTDVPKSVVAFVARQIHLSPSADLSHYATSERHWPHAREIRDHYGYQDFNSQPEHWRLVRWLYSRVWLSNERPSVLFDLTTARLLERKVLLPAASTLSRLIMGIRERASQRLYVEITKPLRNAEREKLEGLLEADEGSRHTRLELLRRAPTRISSSSLLYALQRLNDVRGLGVSEIDLHHLPPNQLRSLARYGLTAWAQTLARMQTQRRLATLLATVQDLERQAMDDALDVFDALVHDLFGKSERKGKRDRLKTLKAYDSASLQLAHTMKVLLNPTLAEMTLEQVFAQMVDKQKLTDAVDIVTALARPLDDEYQQELLQKWGTVRTILQPLFQNVAFQANDAGKDVLSAWHYLKELGPNNRKTLPDAPMETVTQGWQRWMVQEDGKIERKAYVFSTLQNLRTSLRRRDIFVSRSHRYKDPTADLLQGKEWETLRPQVCRMLDLSTKPEIELEKLNKQLDEAYARTSKNLTTNEAVTVETIGGKSSIKLSPLDKLDEPQSLLELRERVALTVPPVDLPEILLEIHERTGFAEEFTHVSEQRATVKDLVTSVCAVLVAEACNIGLEPLVNNSHPALTKSRLSWVQQNYLRAETLTKANARLVDYQATLPLAQQWGGGEVASVDGLRFVVPVRTINAGPNPKYFGVGKGITYLNYTSDQFTGFHGIVIPGTLRDSLYILDGLLEQETSLEPVEVMADTGAYSDVVFGLFWLLGYQFSPRLADVGNARYWRLDKKVNYGALNNLARNVINQKLVHRNWDDFLRVAGSLKLGKVTSSQLMRTLQRGENPSTLSNGIAELGRIAKTLFLLAYLDDESYRRRILLQLNRHEARHTLARKLFHGGRGEVRKKYREGQEDQLSALGLVTNAVILWNTIYTQAALNHLEQRGELCKREDVARLSPLTHEHINVLGRYQFELSDALKGGKLRPLRDPDEAAFGF
jgi:TnpA family transposase